MSNRSKTSSRIPLVIGALLLLTARARANTCSVPSGSYTSIGAALADSNCTIINVAPGTYFEDLFITRAVTINGDAASPTVINGGGMFSVIDAEGSGYTITLNHLTLTNGISQEGGGMNVDGAITVNMNFCTVSGNTAESPDGGSAGVGGGIFNDRGTLNLFNCTVANNTARGISKDGEPYPGMGGGILNDGGTIAAVNSTIADNVADNEDEEPGVGAGIAGSAILTNTLVAGNTHGGILGNCSKAVTDNGYNMSDDATCGLTGTGSAESVADLDLGPLLNNGGPTKTIALLSGSAAIDQIPFGANGCGTTVTSDQRGLSRPQNGSCDIGAFEVCNTALAVKIQREGPVTFCTGSSVELEAIGAASGYLWLKNGAAAPGTNNERTYFATQTGKYSVTVTSPYGCSGASPVAMPVTVLGDPVPTISAIGPTSVACGKTVKLQAAAGLSSYRWYRNSVLISSATKNTYVASSSGSYTVSVTNASGCSGTSAPFAVTVNCLP